MISYGAFSFIGSISLSESCGGGAALRSPSSDSCRMRGRHSSRERKGKEINKIKELVEGTSLDFLF